MGNEPHNRNPASRTQPTRELYARVAEPKYWKSKSPPSRKGREKGGHLPH
jgi:hypothetical protein